MNTRRVLLSAVLVLIACLGAGVALSRPASHPIGHTPPDLHADPVTRAPRDYAGRALPFLARHLHPPTQTP